MSRVVSCTRIRAVLAHFLSPPVFNLVKATWLKTVLSATVAAINPLQELAA